MAWQECVDYVRTIYSPLEETVNVDWTTVPQEDLDNDDFKNGKPFYLVCPDRHCVDYVDQSPAFHQYCQCKDINGNKIPGCTPKKALEPIKSSVCVDIKTREYNGKSSRACINQGADWYQLTCFCCCSCFANGTRITVPGPAGYKKIEDFVAKVDYVSTAKITQNSGGINLTWGSSKVTFSRGTGPDSKQSVMISVIFENPELKDGTFSSIIVTPDHLFLLSTGKLKRADQIVPGKDYFVDEAGESVNIQEVSHGEYNGGVHHIATGHKFTGDMNDHLILAEGVVTGDFTLQISTKEISEYLEDDHHTAPKIGTKKYLAENANLKSVNYAKVRHGDFEKQEVRELNANFYVHGEHTTNIPDTAASYISRAQAKEVEKDLDLIHFTELAPKSSVVQYLIKLYKGFFPDIKIYFDSGLVEANAYAFVNQFGERTVIIAGGLGRIKAMNLEGLSLIIAHMVSTVQQSSPLNYNGYTSVGMADYYSTQILGSVLYNQAFNDTYAKGIVQLQEGLFDHMTKHPIYESDPFKPNIETRLDALDAGSTVNFPPPGIGGPEFQGLNLMDAEAGEPSFNDKSFITDDITIEMSEETFTLLVENEVLDAMGILDPNFNIETDLSFLFDKLDAPLEVLLTEEVRYILLHPVVKVKVRFNMDMSMRHIQEPDEFIFDPEVKTLNAMVSEFEKKTVILSVSGLSNNHQYTLTISNQIHSANGSTVNPEQNSVLIN